MILLVGDPHVTSDALGECEKLIAHICGIAAIGKVHTIIFLGDLYHNHGVVHLSVQKFWKDAFEYLHLNAPKAKIIALVGNHDRSGDISATEHALMLHTDIFVIDKPTVMLGMDTLFMPFMADKNLFIETCKKYPECKYVVAHQEFVGGVYDNGFGISPMAIDPDSIPQEMVISGHIHTTQRFGKVWYPGSPRWRTLHDANVNKAIWLVDDNFKVVEMISTEQSCRKIEVYRDSPEEPVNLGKSFSSITVDVYGPQEYVDARKKHFEAMGHKVRPFPVMERKIKVKESDGIATAFAKYIKELNISCKEEIIKMCQERISWMR